MTASPATGSNSGRRGRIVVRTNRVGPVAQLAVEDNGVGIDAGLDERIFEPFFTTKASGSGLGLAIASQILKEHGGRVRCENHPGDGASFFLDLPLDNAPREGMA